MAEGHRNCDSYWVISKMLKDLILQVFVQKLFSKNVKNFDFPVKFGEGLFEAENKKHKSIPAKKTKN